jgi:hypothetical protein
MNRPSGSPIQGNRIQGGTLSLGRMALSVRSNEHESGGGRFASATRRRAGESIAGMNELENAKKRRFSTRCE